jgi:hypothetical protein
MNDDELLNYLFNVKLILSFSDLYKKAKESHPSIKKSFVKEWFDKQQGIQMTNKKVSKKEFLPIYSDMPYSFQIDLTFLPRYKKQNNGYYVLFTAININTRFVYAYYGKNKDMITILDFLKKLESKTVINSLTCDAGSEFKNKEFQNYCSDNNIQLYFVKNDSHKLGIINRFHRTLKDKLSIYLNTNDTVVWIDIIDKIIYNYNHSVNRGIGIEPYKVNDFIENMIIQDKKEQTKVIISNEDIINVGDKCRILLEKKLFQDKLSPKYSNKIYTIIKVGKNTVSVIDDNEVIKVKKSNIKIISDVSNNTNLTELKKATQSTRAYRINKKDDINESNIIEGKRERKKIL